MINTVSKELNQLVYNEKDLFIVQRALLDTVLKTPEKLIGKEVVITKLIN